jgi:hypothetical protein
MEITPARSFAEWILHHEEIQRMIRTEIGKGGVEVLKPLTGDVDSNLQKRQFSFNKSFALSQTIHGPQMPLPREYAKINMFSQNEPQFDCIPNVSSLNERPKSAAARSVKSLIGDSPLVPSDSEHLDLLALSSSLSELKPSVSSRLSEDREAAVALACRNGAVLSTGMVLKFDHYPGCQKQGLSSKIEGAPNYRPFMMLMNGELLDSDQFGAVEDDNAVPSRDSSLQGAASESFLHGTAMPTEDAIIAVLLKITQNSSRDLQSPFHEKKECSRIGIRWICLREEPAIYVNGRPYVLRLHSNPMMNIETTGITSERVEWMEEMMKKDLLSEQKRYGGKVLLHDEQDGKIVGVFQDAIPDAIKTTKESFQEAFNKTVELMSNAHLKIHYFRVPITDEQTPIPRVYDQLTELIQLQFNIQALTGIKLGDLKDKSNTVVEHSIFNCQVTFN